MRKQKTVWFWTQLGKVINDQTVINEVDLFLLQVINEGHQQEESAIRSLIRFTATPRHHLSLSFYLYISLSFLSSSFYLFTANMHPQTLSIFIFFLLWSTIPIWKLLGCQNMKRPCVTNLVGKTTSFGPDMHYEICGILQSLPKFAKKNYTEIHPEY